MRLRHQALMAVIACACLGGAGCARLASFLLAPQEAAVSAAGGIANTATATAPARSDLAGVAAEVDRLLGGKAANQAELQRIKAELERRLRDPSQDGAAQDEPERLRPWHPRVEAGPPSLGRQPPGDQLRVGPPVAERGLARSGPLPDGTPASELPEPLDLTRIRLGQPRPR